MSESPAAAKQLIVPGIAVVGLIAIGIYVSWLGMTTDELSDTLIRLEADVDEMESRRNALHQSVETHQELHAESKQHAQQLVDKIANYQEQIRLLTERTESLERVGLELGKLQEVMAEFQEVERTLKELIRKAKTRFKEGASR